jgi:hypothetical protein
VGGELGLGQVDERRLKDLMPEMASHHPSCWGLKKRGGGPGQTEKLRDLEAYRNVP